MLLTISTRAQETAFNELAEQQRRREARARRSRSTRRPARSRRWSPCPSFDPNPLASHDTKAAQAAYNKLDADPDKPLLEPGALRDLPPGSTFKVIDSAAALENGINQDTAIPAGSELPAADRGPRRSATPPGVDLPGGTGHADRGAHRVRATPSSPARRGKLGADTDQGEGPAVRLRGRGPDRRPARRARACRWRPAAPGHAERRTASTDPAALAQSSIGQSDVRMTPLQGAMIAATVANGGRQMRPYLVQQLLGPDRTTELLQRRTRRSCASRSAAQVAERPARHDGQRGPERHRPERPDRRLHGRR